MPYNINKKSCKQSDGDSGSYVLSYTDKKGKKHNNCHTSKKKAQGQIAAIEGPREMDETDDMVFGGGGAEADEENDEMEEAILRQWVRERLLSEQAAPSSKAVCKINYPNHKAAADAIATALGATVQRTEPRGAARGLRIVFNPARPLPSAADLLTAVQTALDCTDITGGEIGMNNAYSSKYVSSKFNLPDPKKTKKNHPQELGIVLLHKDAKSKKEGGTSGPGEQELFDGVASIGASEENPVTVVLGNQRFEGVTGVVAPERKHAAGGEPKIDIMLLGAGGQGHPKGAFSLKDAGGAPTYGGWSRIEKHLGAAGKKELEKFIDEYIKVRKPQKNQDGVYVGTGGNFSMPVSDEIATFALYGNAATSGGQSWGKDKVDHLVTVGSTESTISDDGMTITFPGYSVAPSGDLLRGTDWEAYFLYRGASDRVSGPPGKKLQGRIAISNAKRSRQYHSTSSAEETKPKELTPESNLRSIIHNLLLEDLTRADRTEIARIFKKELEKSSAAKKIIRKEVESYDKKTVPGMVDKAFKKNFDKELKKALGVSFFGTPGKINKFVVDEIHDEVEKILGDKATKELIVQICKDVIIKLYRELSFTYKPVIQRLKI